MAALTQGHVPVLLVATRGLMRAAERGVNASDHWYEAYSLCSAQYQPCRSPDRVQYSRVAAVSIVCAMCGTENAYGSQSAYAMCATEIAYGGSVSDEALEKALQVLYAIGLRGRCAMCGTEIAYGTVGLHRVPRAPLRLQAVVPGKYCAVYYMCTDAAHGTTTARCYRSSAAWSVSYAPSRILIALLERWLKLPMRIATVMMVLMRCMTMATLVLTVRCYQGRIAALLNRSDADSFFPDSAGASKRTTALLASGCDHPIEHSSLTAIVVLLQEHCRPTLAYTANPKTIKPCNPTTPTI
eukprot:1128162-Rhodomonas_salina.3